jgi:small conductance mechanosensitive channel
MHIWNQALESLSHTLATSGVQLLGALLISLVGWVAARWVAAGVRRVGARAHRIDRTLVPLLASLAHWTILAVTLVAVLEKFGIPTSSVLAVLGSLGLAVGLSLKDTISDLAAGVVLLLLRPFDVGDAVNLGGTAGVVEAIDLFETKLTSFDGVPLVMPNSKVRGSVVENYSRAQERRIELVVGVAPGELDRARQVITRVLASEARILPEPAPRVDLQELGGSAAHLLVRGYCPAPELQSTRTALTRRLEEELAGIQLTLQPGSSKP